MADQRYCNLEDVHPADSSYFSSIAIAINYNRKLIDAF